MALLQDLIRISAGDETSTASVLRQARVIATRLHIKEAQDWIDHELNGYTDMEVPPYRGPFKCPVQGHFVGPFGASLSRAPVAVELLPDMLRGELSQVRIRQGVAEIEDLISRSPESGDFLQSPWPAGAVAMFNTLQGRGDFTLYPGMGALNIWNTITRSQMRAILDTVRTRILDFALGLEMEDPQAGDKAGESIVTPEKAGEIFNTVINAPGANVAIKSSDFTQNSYTVRPATDEELLQQLRIAGLNEALLTDLRSALLSDRQETKGELTEPGPKVQGWIGRVMALGARSSAAIGTAITSDVATAMVLHYFGLSN